MEEKLLQHATREESFSNMQTAWKCRKFFLKLKYSSVRGKAKEDIY